MIVVRDTFRVKFGMASQFKHQILDGKRFFEGADSEVRGVRILSDYVAEYYTFVLELTFESLAAMERSFAAGMKDAEWRSWYHNNIVPLCEGGRREVFTIVG